MPYGNAADETEDAHIVVDICKTGTNKMVLAICNVKHKWPPRKHIVVYTDKIGTNKMQQTKTKLYIVGNDLQ